MHRKEYLRERKLCLEQTCTRMTFFSLNLKFSTAHRTACWLFLSLSIATAIKGVPLSLIFVLVAYWSGDFFAPRYDMSAICVAGQRGGAWRRRHPGDGGCSLLPWRVSDDAYASTWSAAAAEEVSVCKFGEIWFKFDHLFSWSMFLTPSFVGSRGAHAPLYF